jgi:hypothetical protein
LTAHKEIQEVQDHWILCNIIERLLLLAHAEFFCALSLGWSSCLGWAFWVPRVWG